MAQRRLRGLQVQLRSVHADLSSAAQTEPEKLRSPWSDDDGSIRAAWRHGDSAAYARGDRKKTFAVLSEADHEFFEREGWVLIHNAVPRENVEAMKNATWKFLGMDPADPETWYRQGHSGMVQLYQDQTQWDNRAHPRVHQAFADLFGTEKLWCSFDMTHMKPPARAPHWDSGGFVHWDLGEDILRQPLHLRVQGELLLEDMPANAGGFQCISGFHLRVADWVAQQPEGAPVRVPSLDDPFMAGEKLTHVEGKAGDLLIWHSFLPHGSCRNESMQPRMMQLITMFPYDSHSTFKTNYLGKTPTTLEDERERRVAMWRERLHLASFDGAWDPKVNRYHTTGFGGARELTPATPAVLSELGEKLLGLRPWE